MNSEGGWELPDPKKSEGEGLRLPLKDRQEIGRKKGSLG